MDFLAKRSVDGHGWLRRVRGIGMLGYTYLTSRYRRAKVKGLLRRAELLLEEQVRAVSHRSCQDELCLAAVDCELNCYEEVDKEAYQVASGLAWWYRHGQPVHFNVVRNRYCEPVLFRVRDARRYLSEKGAIPPDWGHRPDRIFAELLVDRWHDYAEPYWRQRWLRASLGAGRAPLR